MIPRSFQVLAAACLLALTAPTFAQARPATPAPAKPPATPAKPPATPAKPAAAPTTAQAAATTRRTALETQLKSSNMAQVAAAFAAYKAWFAEDAKAGENAFWTSRPIIMPLADHANDTLELIELAKKYKLDANSAKYGYCFALQAMSLMQLDKTQEALAAAKEGLERDAESAADEMRINLVPALSPLKKHKEIADLFALAIAACPATPAITDSLLKQRITTFNAMKDYALGLATAKSYFNVTALANTSDAITILDRQFLLPNMDDRSKVEQFRKEATAGAASTPPGQAARTSPLVLAVKVDSGPYEEALKKLNDDNLTNIIKHVSLLLIADKPKEALDSAKQALAIANNPKEITTANELIARCYKAQDGTIGRANGWIAANPQAK